MAEVDKPFSPLLPREEIRFFFPTLVRPVPWAPLSFLSLSSLRGKCLRGLGEQREIEKRDFTRYSYAKKWGRAKITYL